MGTDQDGGGEMNPILSRPKDKSLDAFKAWINEITDAFGANKSDLAEEKWVAGW